MSECYQSLTAHQHQKGHTVPKQVITIATSIQVTVYSLSTALCESIRYQAKSEQNVRQDLIPRVGHGEAALCTPSWDQYIELTSIAYIPEIIYTHASLYVIYSIFFTKSSCYMVPCCFGRRQLKVVPPNVRHFAELFSATVFYIVMFLIKLLIYLNIEFVNSWLNSKCLNECIRGNYLLTRMDTVSAVDLRNWDWSIQVTWSASSGYISHWFSEQWRSLILASGQSRANSEIITKDLSADGIQGTRWRDPSRLSPSKSRQRFMLGIRISEHLSLPSKFRVTRATIV